MWTLDALLRLFSFESSDGSGWLFSTPSWSRPNSGITHLVEIDKTGWIRCLCEDCVMRKKGGYITDPNLNICRHGSAVLLMLKMLNEQGE